MRMAPGTSSMLRARRRDVNVKPNRVLDRSSSRGMIYENEELRLRTININAEVERSQSDIKKLRRENEQLKREIWQLREEYDRLEDILKEKQQSEEQEEESEDEGDEEDEEEENGDDNGEESEEKENADQENKQNQRKAGSIRKTFDNLSIVEEVPEESPENGGVPALSPAQAMSHPPGTVLPPQPQTQCLSPPHLRGMPRPPPPPPPLVPPGVDTNRYPELGNRVTNPFLQPTPTPGCQCCRLRLASEREATHGNPGQVMAPTHPAGPLLNGHVTDRVAEDRLPDGDNYFDGSEGDCMDNCTSLEHRLNAMLRGPGYCSLPGHAINGVVQEVKYCTTPANSRGADTQVYGELLTTILTRRQSFQAKVDPQTGAKLRNDDANSFQCTPFSESESTQFLRLNSVQPFTLSFQTQELPNITVQEVIDSLLSQLSSDLQLSLKGVRMVGNSCFVSFGRQADLDRVLASGFKIKDKTVQLSDASFGTSVIALSGVPHHIPDQAIDKILSKYGCLVGQVERRVYKGVDIGERFVRLRAKLAVPRYISISGHPVKIRILHDDEVNNLNISRRRSFRSQLNIRLTVPSDDQISSESLDQPQTVNDSQPSLSDRTVPQIHLTPPIPPLPSESVGENTNIVPPSINAPYNHYNPFNSARSPASQNFTPSTESLENKTNSSRNTHHSLPDFLSSDVTSSDPHFFTYPICSGAQSDPHFYPATSGVVSAPGTLSQERNKGTESGTKSPITGATPLTNQSTNCFQFPAGPSAQFGRTRDCRNQSPPSSVDKKTCSSDKDLDSEREKKAEKGKKKPKKGKQGKQAKQAERKPGPGVTSTECSQSSSSGQDSPSKTRRQLSVNFKREGVGGGGGASPIFRTGSLERPRLERDRDGPGVAGGPSDLVGNCSEFERSNSETSSRFGTGNAPRKMSTTGREKAKVPWCGCWGNGCC